MANFNEQLRNKSPEEMLDMLEGQTDATWQTNAVRMEFQRLALNAAMAAADAQKDAAEVQKDTARWVKITGISTCIVAVATFATALAAYLAIPS